MALCCVAATAMAAETPPPPPLRRKASHALKSVSELDSRKLDVDPETLPGAAVFRDHCAQCHLGQVPKAPQKMFLQMMSGPTIHEALDAGLMKGQAQSLTEKERVEVAEYLSGGAPGGGASIRAAQDVHRGRSIDLT